MWRSTGNWTLNMGLQYEIQTAPRDRFDRLSYFVAEKNSIGDKVGQTLIGALRYTGGGNPRGIYDPQPTNLPPRVGLTYSPGQKMVMRAGFGIFYTPAIEFGDYQGLSLNGFTQTTPFRGAVDGVAPPYPLSH